MRHPPDPLPYSQALACAHNPPRLPRVSAATATRQIARRPLDCAHASHTGRTHARNARTQRTHSTNTIINRVGMAPSASSGPPELRAHRGRRRRPYPPRQWAPCVREAWPPRSGRTVACGSSAHRIRMHRLRMRRVVSRNAPLQRRFAHPGRPPSGASPVRGVPR